MSGSVHISFYATLFRGDALHKALKDIASKAPHYGATGWAVYRYQDDLYKFLTTFEFESKEDFKRYWNSEEFLDFRIFNKGYFQVPLIYSWTEKTSDSPVHATS